MEFTTGSLSPDPWKMTVSPVVIRNLKDNTSEIVSTPRVVECPKENGDVAGSAHALVRSFFSLCVPVVSRESEIKTVIFLGAVGKN